jgi:hypothetical protein
MGRDQRQEGALAEQSDSLARGIREPGVAINKTRTRRLRRKSRATQKHGRAAGPTHKLRAGRTGAVHSKKTPPKSRPTSDNRRRGAAVQLDAS